MKVGRTRLRLARVGPVFLAVLPTLAFVAQRHPASTDFPEHTLAIGALRGLLLGHEAHTSFYTSNLATSPYLAYHALGALLATLLGSAALANRVLVVLVAAAFPLAFRRLLGAVGADRRLVWLSVMPFFSRALSIGFLPYLMSIPIGLVLVADAVRAANVDPGERRAWLATQAKLALLGSALFFSHLSSLTIFAPTAVLAASVSVWPRGGTPGKRLERLWLSNVWAALPLVLVGRLALVGRLSADVDHPVDAPAYMSIARSLHALPLWVFDNYSHRWDDAAALGYWLVFSAAAAYTLVRVSRGRVRIPIVRLVPLLVAVLVYLVTPFRVGAALFLNVRLAPVLVLLALVPLRLPPLRIMTKLVAAVTTLAGAVFVVSAYACESVEADGLTAVLRAIRPGASVLSLSFERKPHLTYISAYLYPASELRRTRGGKSAFRSPLYLTGRLAIAARRCATGPSGCSRLASTETRSTGFATTTSWSVGHEPRSSALRGALATRLSRRAAGTRSTNGYRAPSTGPTKGRARARATWSTRRRRTRCRRSDHRDEAW